MLIGYARFSKADGTQVLDLQRDCLIDAGVEPVHLYEDKASGKKGGPPCPRRLPEGCAWGDTLVVWKPDRLGRDLKHLVDIAQDLTDRVSA